MKPTPITPEALELVRELRGIVEVDERLRFCASLLSGTHPAGLEVRITVVRSILMSLALELAAAKVRVEVPRASRVMAMLEDIGALATTGRVRVRGDRLSKIYHAAREARRLLRQIA